MKSSGTIFDETFGWGKFASVTKEMIHLQFLDVFDALSGTSADGGLLVATAEPFGTTRPGLLGQNTFGPSCVQHSKNHF